jgi:hypothetical protein
MTRDADRRMSEMFRQDQYPPADQYPLPRLDPRLYGVLAKQRATETARAAKEPLVRDSGVLDLGRRPFQYGKPESYIQQSPEELDAIRDTHDQMLARMGRGQIDPERFSDMLTRRPESPNAVWLFDDRFRGM